MRASELTERIRTEQAAGRFVADVEQNGAATIILQHRNGLIQPHGGVPNLKNLRPELQADDIRVPGLRAGVRHPDQHRAGQARRRAQEPGRTSTTRNGRARSSPTITARSGGGNVFFFATYQKARRGVPQGAGGATRRCSVATSATTSAASRAANSRSTSRCLSEHHGAQRAAGQVDRCRRKAALHPLRLRHAQERAASQCRAPVHQSLSRGERRLLYAIAGLDPVGHRRCSKNRCRDAR